MEPLMKGFDMKPRLKKAFQLTGNNIQGRNLSLLQERLEAEGVMFNKAKLDLASALSKRNRALNSLIQEQFSYTLELGDMVQFNPYTNEIFIFTLPNENNVNEEN